MGIVLHLPLLLAPVDLPVCSIVCRRQVDLLWALWTAVVLLPLRVRSPRSEWRTRWICGANGTVRSMRSIWRLWSKRR